MSPNELLERRAQRGSHRGASQVWADVQSELHDEGNATARSKTGLRIALVLSAAALIAVAGLATLPLGDSDSIVVPVTSDEADDVDPLPAPILIDGMELDRVNKPWNESSDEAPTFSRGSTAGDVVSTRVYAGGVDSYDGPVVGVDTLSGGGVNLWSANLSVEELSELTGSIVRDGSTWRLPDEVELVEVAWFEDDPMDMLIEGWQFDFRDGAAEATLQAEPGSTNWIWLARALRHSSDEVANTPSSATVLGNDGVVLNDEVLWVEDGFVYRLTASELVGGTWELRPAEPVLDRLRVADRAEWESAVGNTGWLRSSSVVVTMSLLAFVAWAVAVAALALRNRKQALVLVVSIALGGLAFLALAPSSLFFLALAALSFGVFALLRLQGMGGS